MRTEEHNLQKACVTWFRLQYPNYIIFAIPNGAKRTARQGHYYKEEGLTAGVPDLMIAEPVGYFSGFFIEMKTENKNSKPSPAQVEMIKKLQARGYKVAICRNLDSFIAEVTSYFKSANPIQG